MTPQSYQLRTPDKKKRHNMDRPIMCSLLTPEAEEHATTGK
jgi:hypothetical protein